jgi:uncharacterized protein (DUF3820 family)
MSISSYLDSNNPEHIRMMSYIVPGGKNKGKLAIELYDNDADYCMWCEANFNKGWGMEFNSVIREFKRLKYVAETAKLIPKTVEQISFGKYKGCPIPDLVQSDPQYCNWIMLAFPFGDYQNWLDVKYTIARTRPIPVAEPTRELNSSTDTTPLHVTMAELVIDETDVAAELYFMIKSMSRRERELLTRVIIDNTISPNHTRLANFIRRSFPEST